MMSAEEEITSLIASITQSLIHATNYFEKVAILSQVPRDWSIGKIANTFGVSHSVATKARHYRRRSDTISKQRVQQSSIYVNTQLQPSSEYFRYQSEDMAGESSVQSGGRPKSKIVDFFTYNMDERKAFCRISNCSYAATTHTGNQTRHMQTIHPEIYKEFVSSLQGNDLNAPTSTDTDDSKRFQCSTMSRVPFTEDIAGEVLLPFVTVDEPKTRHQRRRSDATSKQRVQQPSIRLNTQLQSTTPEYLRYQSEDTAGESSAQNNGGRRKSKIVDFFTYNMDERKAFCRLNNCTYSATTHTGNQTRHIQTIHPEIYREFVSSSQDNDPIALTSTDTDDYKRNQNYTLSRVALTADIVREGLLQLVTINGRPFTIVDDTGFRMILDPILESLPKHDPLVVNRDTVKYYVHEEAMRIKSCIKVEVKKCGLVSLKVDIASCHGRYFLGVNIQFVKEEEIVIRTLGIVEIHDRHSSENLKKIIIDIVKSFDLSISNIYSFTSDNASNMVKLCRLLNEEKESVTSAESTLSEATGHYPLGIIDDDEDDSDNDEYCDDNNDDLDDDSVIVPKEVPKIPDEQDLIRLLDGCSTLEGEQLEISNIRCVAHNLQLAVEDAIAMKNFGKVTAKARAAAKYFRKHTAMYEVRKLRPNIAKPKLDIPTRWHSTFDMLESLIAFKDFSSQVQNYLTEADWKKLEEYVVSLKPAKIATKKLETEQLLLTDFYVTWLSCAAQTKRIVTPFAENIVECMERRQVALFANDALLAAVFLDPLTNATLRDDQKARATHHLLQVWERLGNLRSRDCVKSDLDDDVAMFLNEARKQKKNARSVDSTGRDIRPQLQRFFDDEVRDVQDNLLKYWERNKFVMPELYQLSKIILGAPATQVSVERLFSGLRFICLTMRRRIGDDDLNNVLVVRSNYKEFCQNPDFHKIKKKRRKNSVNLETNA